MLDKARANITMPLFLHMFSVRPSSAKHFQITKSTSPN